jgi:hypothetical protein
MNDYIKKMDRFIVNNIKIYLNLIDSPLFEGEEKEIKQHFKKIKDLFFKASILEKENKVDPYQEEEKPEFDKQHESKKERPAKWWV